MPPLSVCDTNISVHNERYSLNDLHKAAGSERKHQPSNFLRVEQTQELIAEIDKSSDVRISHEVIRGKNGGTFVCRELVYAYAMWISPKFNLAVIRAFDAMVNDRFVDANKMVQPESVAVPAIEYKPLTGSQIAKINRIILTRASQYPHSAFESVTRKLYQRLAMQFQQESYKKIDRRQFGEACDYVQNAVIEGEFIGAGESARRDMQPHPQYHHYGEPNKMAAPPPQYTRPDVISIPVADWFAICNIIRGINDQVRDRLDNYRYNTIEPKLAVDINRAIGMIYTHTFAAFGKGGM